MAEANEHQAVERERRLAKKYWWTGCAGLPLLWLLGVCMFWESSDRAVKQMRRRCLIGALAVGSILAAWAISFAAGALPSETTWRLNVSNYPLLLG